MDFINWAIFCPNHMKTRPCPLCSFNSRPVRHLKMIQDLKCPGGTSIWGGRRAWTSHQVWRQNLGRQIHQIRARTWEVLFSQDAKVGKKFQFWVISEIQRAKFGVFVTYIFGGKIWGSNKNFRGKISGSNKNFRGKFWGQAPNLLIWK